MSNFAKRSDVVSHRFKDGRKELGAGFNLAVIGVRAMPRGHQPGQKREAIGATGWRGDIGVVKSHASCSEPIHGRGPNVLRAVYRGVQSTEIVRDKDDNIGQLRCHYWRRDEKE